MTSKTKCLLASSSEDETGNDCVRTVCWAANDDQMVDDSAYTLGNVLALRIVLNGPRIVVGAEVYTGKIRSSSTLALWSDVSPNTPGEQISSGTWNVNNTIAWQGADFATPVERSDREPFWIVWQVAKDAQAPVSLTGTQHSYSYRATGATTWRTGQARWMMRVYCCE